MRMRIREKNMKKILMVLLAGFLTASVALAQGTPEKGKALTYPQLASLLVKALGLAEYLPAAPTTQQLFDILMQNGIAPADGWTMDEEAAVSKGDLARVLIQAMQRKSQKAQMELQTVNGQGAQTQKMMMWMMPIMMAIFAFMYTAAFSLYIVISSVISLLTTFLINFIADKKFKPKEAGENEVIRGRVYIPPKKEEEPKQKKKKDKTVEDGFLSGLADKKKHTRGRLK